MELLCVEGAEGKLLVLQYQDACSYTSVTLAFVILLLTCDYFQFLLLLIHLSCITNQTIIIIIIIIII